MRVYYSSANYSSSPTNRDKLITSFIEKKHEIINKGSILKKPSKKTYFKREKQLIDSADFLIIEVTQSSIDIGGIVVYALTKDIPVLALIFEEEKDSLTPMLEGNTSDWLFLEHYSEKSISYILNDFFKYMSTVKNKKGAMVVIDGGDGSGKATQAALLSEYFKKNKIPHRIYDFPRYYSSFHGKTIGRMLSGEFGTLDNLSPYLASLAYALDRASLKQEMDDYLKIGGIIICNRYATSNMAHQGAKIDNPLKQKEYLDWVYELEYKIHKIPQEDLVIYLYVPWKIGMELTFKKKKRGYLKSGSLDIAEKDIEHRKSAEAMYLQLCKKYSHWVKINCINSKKKLKTKQEIHNKILSVLKKRKII